MFEKLPRLFATVNDKLDLSKPLKVPGRNIVMLVYGKVHRAPLAEGSTRPGKSESLSRNFQGLFDSAERPRLNHPSDNLNRLPLARAGNFFCKRLDTPQALKIFGRAGKIFIASKFGRHETGIEYVQGKLENIFGSGGNFIVATDFGGTARLVRSGLNRRGVELFLFPVDGSPARSRRQLTCRQRKEDYARRLAVEAFNALHGLGGRCPHFHRTFLGNGGLVRSVLLDRAVRPGSFRG